MTETQHEEKMAKKVSDWVDEEILNDVLKQNGVKGMSESIKATELTEAIKDIQVQHMEELFGSDKLDRIKTASDAIELIKNANLMKNFKVFVKDKIVIKRIFPKMSDVEVKELQLKFGG